MKFLNNISLRMRVTLLAGSILIICSIILTVMASHNANMQFGVLNNAVLYPSDLKEITIDAFDISDAEFGAFTVAKKEFNTQSMIMLAIICVLGTGMVYIVAGKSLQPISALSKKISMITEKDLHTRIEEDKRNDEIALLSGSFNTMLDRLEESFLRQKRFSANVAHELKTPLTIINTGIQVLSLEENPSVSDYKKALDMTERNTNRLIAVVDDLLTLCDERRITKSDEINIRILLDSICTELSPLVNDKSLKLENKCPDQIVCGNSRLIYRAFYNILENAIKYNKAHGEIYIYSEIKGNTGEIKIRDTGDGIAEDEIQYIFDPFYCIDKSRSRRLGGAGLGLSIVKTILDNHGWGIFIESEIGVGSTFTVSFPI